MKLARTNLENVTLEEAKKIMSEGISESEEIISALCRIGGKKMMENFSHKDIEDRANDYHWGAFSILLRLDDMNIRGIQIKYASDFCNGDMDVLFDHLNGEHVYNEDLKCSLLTQGTQRQIDLVDYINIRVAKDCDDKEGFVPLACLHGASFERSGWNAYYHEYVELDMSYSVIKELKNKELPKASGIDYSSLDIVEDTPTEKAIKIAEAHGFEVILRKSCGDSFGDPVETIIMAKGAHDILIADKATKDNFCYGGCEITGGRESGSLDFNWDDHISFGPYENDDTKSLISQFEVTHHHGLFKGYEKVPDDHEVSIETREIGGITGIPIPDFIDDYDINMAMKKDIENGTLHTKFQIITHDWMTPYRLGKMASLLMIDELIKEMSPRGKEIYQRILDHQFDEAYSYFKEVIESKLCDEMEIFMLLRKYTDVPQSKLDVFQKEIIKKIS